MMRQSLRKIVFWTPSVLGLLFAPFIGIFALDVFGQGYGFWGTMAEYREAATTAWAGPGVIEVRNQLKVV
jgi:hypothetical protein